MKLSNQQALLIVHRDRNSNHINRKTERGETYIQGTEETSKNVYKNLTEIRNYIVSRKQESEAIKKETLREQDRSMKKKRQSFKVDSNIKLKTLP